MKEYVYINSKLFQAILAEKSLMGQKFREYLGGSAVGKCQVR